jgi:transcription antitermination factor NusG
MVKIENKNMISDCWMVASISSPDAAGDIEELGHKVFLPLVWGKATVGHKEIDKTFPLFPGYLFVEYGDDWRELYAVKGLLKVLGLDGIPSIVDARLVSLYASSMMQGEGAIRLDLLVQALEKAGFIPKRPGAYGERFQPGDIVCITAGPHVGLFGEVQHMKQPRGRRKIRLDYMGASRVVSVPLHLLAPPYGVSAAAV